ncbi:MAG: excinuclease ABC subunit UvrA [Candidatus Omnitrophota bacterium]|nr:MAG: excinuclease ABC subunit UvrA [Candidatus Omnitrophota bacterium]
MQNKFIVIKGAKEHNLKSLDLKLPRDKLIVITGLSGSGKSSLAFDTIYAEGQRRYVESLSAYARQFLGQMHKPDVEYIEGLSPSIAIEQRTASANPRSTVATQTEIYDYLRLLFARVGVPYCYSCGKKISQQSSQQIVEQILQLPEGSRLYIFAPLVCGRKGEYRAVFETAAKAGFVRARVDGEIYDLTAQIKLNKKKKHTIEILVDRIILKQSEKTRIADSVETALKAGKGTVIVGRQDSAGNIEEMIFSEVYACLKCGISYAELQPRMFSFNSPYGACPECGGLGTNMKIDEDLVVPERAKTLREGALQPWRRGGKGYLMYYRGMLGELAATVGFSLDVEFKRLDKGVQNLVLYGGDVYVWGKKYEGIIPHLTRLFAKTESEFLKQEINKYMSSLPCPVCRGARLRKESLAVKVGGKSIYELTRLSISDAFKFFNRLNLNEKDTLIAYQILKEIRQRLKFMQDVGLGYLTLDRQSSTLSGGEAQRIRLATQIGSKLTGVIYILDEPSIGLHQRDNEKLLRTLKSLRDLGNTLIIVEHDEDTIRNADYIVDLGPGAGRAGGNIVCMGNLKQILSTKRSQTAQYLTGNFKAKLQLKQRSLKKRKYLEIIGAREHNLKNINVKIPLGLFVCVTGVSGSGKSTLVDEILYKALAQKIFFSKHKPGKHKQIKGIKNIDKVIVIDQSPIGRTPRSNPATYTGIFSPIRDFFAKLPEAKLKGYGPGRFSFNVKGGRCEACKGDGIKKIEMHFLADVYVECEVCKGKRYNTQTLEVAYKGKSISDILEMTVEEAVGFFKNIPRIAQKLAVLEDVGLGYIQLGQPATTLSGGEAQRIKLSSELSKKATGRTLYILDEPTTGLHFVDIDKLLSVLHRLVDYGNTVLIIEHNLDVVRTADYIIDLGPEGGENGGKVVGSGTIEQLMRNKDSYTGKYLQKHLYSNVIGL